MPQYAKNCYIGKSCGYTCISKKYTCHKGGAVFDDRIGEMVNPGRYEQFCQTAKKAELIQHLRRLGGYDQINLEAWSKGDLKSECHRVDKDY